MAMLAERSTVHLIPGKLVAPGAVIVNITPCLVALIVRAQILKELALLIPRPDRRIVRAATRFAVRSATVNAAVRPQWEQAPLGSAEGTEHAHSWTAETCAVPGAIQAAGRVPASGETPISGELDNTSKEPHSHSFAGEIGTELSLFAKQEQRDREHRPQVQKEFGSAEPKSHDDY